MKFKNYFKVLFIGVSLIFLNGFKTYSQQIYATTATEISEGERVDNVDNAAIIDSLFARVNSAGSYSGELKLEFPSTVPANSAAYIKVDDLGKGDLDILLGGSIGDLLADAGGTTSYGDHYVQVSALDSIGEVVAVGDTNNLFNDPQLFNAVPLKVVKNKDGDLFITITPTVAYNAIVIKDITETLAPISAANFTNVYYAFYLDPTDTSCNSEEIFTSFDGTGYTLDLLGFGVTGVEDLEFAIDNDSTSFSTISVGIISAEASMYQDIYFSTTATNEDILDLSIRPKSGLIFNVALDRNITIALYREDEVVFSQTLDAVPVIETFPTQDGEITKIKVTPEVEFDRLRVTLASPLGFNLEQQVDLFSVKVTPPPPTAPNPQYFCAVNNPTIANLEATATGTLIWYDTITGREAYAADTPLIDGKKYYGANLTGTCESTERVEVTVILKNPEKPLGNAEQSFCLINKPTIENLIATAPAATPGTIIWYATETGVDAFATNFELTNNGVYYAANSYEYPDANPDKACESSERLKVTVTIADPEKPDGDPNQSFCVIDNPTIENLIVDASGTIIWYDALTGGTAYATVVTLQDGLKYYAANFDGTCESERLEVTVKISDTNPPSGANPQTFCSTQGATIADLEATASGTIIWYNKPTEGTAYTNTDALVNELKYYAANFDESCESSQRLEVLVTIQNPKKPEGPAEQSFCTIDEPTIANLEATATGTIIWYDKQTGGTAYNETNPLENALKYYAANSNGTCESTERLKVTVTIADPEKPDGDPNQSFCVIDEPTIADLKATASGTIIWYDALTGGTAYATVVALQDELKYYAANFDGICESSERLEVTVKISDTNPPSEEATQTFCSSEAATVSNLRANASGTITWYDQPTKGTLYANTDALANGIYYAANSDGSCESSERLKVTVVITTAQDITIEGKNTNICFADVETYRVPDGHAPYTWDIAGGNLVSGGMADDNEIEIEWINITSAKVSVSLTGGCYSSNSAEQIVEVVVCSDLTVKQEVDFIKPTVEDTITFTIDIKNSDKSVFKDIIISEVLPSGFTYESYTTSLGIYTPSNEIWNIPSLGANGSATLTLTVKVNTTGDYLNRASIIQSIPIDADTSNNTAETLVTPSCLKIYNIITPNGDGLNDNFVISCVKDADIEIYDRYGSIVYKNQNYTNDWNGVANQNGKIIGKGEKLPNGTYFFVLRFNDGSTENIKSYIQIIR
jgi:gliding motility-associated-like protein/uncharacterized repeat protein (TIGR01451 family)